MPYPANVAKLVFGGPLSDADEWQMSLWLRYSGTGDPGLSQAIRDYLKTGLRAWWQTNGTGIGSNALLKWAKLNAIRPDGKYANPYTNEWLLIDDPSSAGLAPVSTTPGHPQMSLALSHVTSVSRGQAARGRVYPPACNFGANSAGKVSGSAAAAAGEAWATFLGKINSFGADGEMSLKPVVVSNGVKSNAAGLARVIRAVRVGDEIDVQQRRRTAAPEGYVSQAVIGAVPEPDEPLGGPFPLETE